MMADAWMRCMRRGDFEGAWALSDAGRQPIPADEWTRPRHEQRIWNGTPVQGRRVLVRCYHGLGDTIQFLRFLPPLARLARSVTLWIQPALIPLVTEMEGVDGVLALHDGAPGTDYDVDAEIMELPYVLRTTLATLPAAVPYLRLPTVADESSGAHRQLPASRSPRRVAVAWRAGEWDPARSMPASIAARMFEGIDVELDVLLPRLFDEELKFFPPPPDRNSLIDAASRMLASDLVITVDTVFAHLAGALGRPAWVLLPNAADWRWMDEREDSPWYPTVRLFRQSGEGWTGVADRVRTELMRTR